MRQSTASELERCRDRKPRTEDHRFAEGDRKAASRARAVAVRTRPARRRVDIGCALREESWMLASVHRIEGTPLSSTVSGPLIADHIDGIYRTCAVGTVTVTPPAVTLQLDGAKIFNATWQALDGLPLATSDSVAWSIDSSLASVSPHGRVVAGSVPGMVSLQAKVRSVVGTADISIVDDSVKATYTPPVVTVSTRKEIGYVWPGPVGPGLPYGRSDVTWMTIAASAMSGASIASAMIYQMTPDGVESGNEVPVNQEFSYFQCNIYIGDFLIPYTIDAPTPPYRLVVTDSHGLVTEISGSVP